ncbi:MAG: tRNA lysidine(34) synthetase TilS [Omnitrophica bacterium RIFOXYB12_FULL_50_7]|nr:MAG: tRNA lysidine(34) synthetase TilS [Omnitrophica bacterium RIFOXYB12_FULL_50_7]
MKKTHSNLLPRLEEHFRDRRFFKVRQKILVACSGGPDSVALFHLLRALITKYDWKLGLVHFNHQLRPSDAKKDERFVKALARKFKAPFYCGTGSVKHEAKRTKTSIEEAARKMRYDFFLQTAQAKKFQAIALAHTRDDQAETVLMRVLQGTGLRGLQGIREKFRTGRVTWVRPLLVFTKKELLQYLTEQKIFYRFDKSNDSSRFIRNRIRLELIPQLQRDFNPRVVEALSRIPAIVAGESALIEELEEKAWKKTFKKRRGKNVELRRSVFLKSPPALQFRIVEKALKMLNKQSGLSFEAWERIRQGLVRHRYRSSLPKDIDFALTPKNVTIFMKQEVHNQI